MDKTTQIVFIVFTAVLTVSVLIQTSAVVAMFLAARKMQKKTQVLVEELRAHILPTINSSRAVIEDLAPKLKVVSGNLVETSDRLRGMAVEVSGVVGDVAQRTRAQAAHVDSMVEGTLDQLAHATQSIQHGIAVPVRQVAGVVNGVRAALNVMLAKQPIRDCEGVDDLFV
ncbi:MAG TPA: hypothetical protein VGR96_18420 [Acidobacteriaceae bacterium]|nr:hypothetical protein [Acidobacteriaceae bacterium]